MRALSSSKKKLAETTDDADWQAVYREELPKVFHFFCYRIGDVHVAEDLTSTTFEKAWRSRSRYRHDLGTYSNWLFGIARKVAVDYYRRHAKEVPLDDAFSVASDDSPDETLQRQDDFKRLTKLLVLLSDREQELIALKYGAALTNRAIAEITNLSESNVGTILHRIVSKLRNEWEK